MKKLMVSRKDLKNNLKVVRKILNCQGKDDSGNFPKIIAVVKGNGMGLGLVPYAKFLVNNGIDFLAVANLEEALALRQAGIETEILMLTPFSNEKDLVQLIKNKMSLPISSIHHMELIEKSAKKAKTKIKAHVKIDTGFGRYGFLYQNLQNILLLFKMCDTIEITRNVYAFCKTNGRKIYEFAI